MLKVLSAVLIVVFPVNVPPRVIFWLETDKPLVAPVIVPPPPLLALTQLVVLV